MCTTPNDGGRNRVRKVVERLNNKPEDRIYRDGWETYREWNNKNLKLERTSLHLEDDTGRIAIAETLAFDNNAVSSTHSLSTQQPPGLNHPETKFE